MDKQLSREVLIQRIADLEAELVHRDNPETNCSIEAFGLAHFEHAADGICVCHAIDAFPHVRFTF